MLTGWIPPCHLKWAHLLSILQAKVVVLPNGMMIRSGEEYASNRRMPSDEHEANWKHLLSALICFVSGMCVQNTSPIFACHCLVSGTFVQNASPMFARHIWRSDLKLL